MTDTNRIGGTAFLILGYRLMVGRLTLDQVVGVRVPVPQPHAASLFDRAALWHLTRDHLMHRIPQAGRWVVQRLQESPYE